MGEEDDHQKDDENVPDGDEDSEVLKGDEKVADAIAEGVDLIRFNDSECRLWAFL